MCSQLPSISGGHLLLLQPEDVPCHGDRDPHNIVTMIIKNTEGITTVHIMKTGHLKPAVECQLFM